MSSSYSLAEARSHLSRLVDEVEQGLPVELTRRGQPVAMVVSMADYRRLERPARPLWAIVEDLRRRHDLEQLDIDPDEIFAVSEAATNGSDFSW